MRLPYLGAWFVLAVLVVANGVIREKTYGKALSELRAHQASTVIAGTLVGLVTALWNVLWPIRNASEAWSIGALWLLMTVCFEFGFGHYVAGHSWQKLLADYNLLAGRVWSVFLAWLFVVPYLCFLASKAAI